MALPGDRREPEPDRRQLGLRVIGAGLLIATGAVHLDLYLTGYRTIPTIGGLFLFQVIFAFGLGLIVLVSRSRLVSAAGAGFAIATLGGYLLSLRVGLFGFREVRTTAGIAAGVIEVGTFVALAAFVLSPRPQSVGPGMEGARLTDKLAAAIPAARWAAARVLGGGRRTVRGLAGGDEGPPQRAGAVGRPLLETVKIHGVAVVTDAQGYTLYWFAPDSPTKSTCYGTCAVYWPPLTGDPVAGPGVTGRLGRSSGQAAGRRSPITAIRCTPTSAIPLLARPTATTST